MGKLKSVEKLFEGRHFDREVTIPCVRWYLRFRLTLRDLADSSPRQNEAGKYCSASAKTSITVCEPRRVCRRPFCLSHTAMAGSSNAARFTFHPLQNGAMHSVSHHVAVFDCQLIYLTLN